MVVGVTERIATLKLPVLPENYSWNVSASVEFGTGEKDHLYLSLLEKTTEQLPLRRFSRKPRTRQMIMLWDVAWLGKADLFFDSANDLAHEIAWNNAATIYSSVFEGREPAFGETFDHINSANFVFDLNTPGK